MIIVLGSVRVAAADVDETLALAREHVVRSRAEPGCLAHAVHRDDDDPTRLVFVERWADAESLAAHFAVPASRAFGKRLAALAVEPSEIALYEATALPSPLARKGAA